MRILINGLGGAMGRETARLALAGYRGAALAGGVSPHGCDDFGVPCAADFSGAVTDVDCVVDFSHHSMTGELLSFVKEYRLPLVLATTGHTEEERAAKLVSEDLALLERRFSRTEEYLCAQTMLNNGFSVKAKRDENTANDDTVTVMYYDPAKGNDGAITFTAAA